GRAHRPGREHNPLVSPPEPRQVSRATQLIDPPRRMTPLQAIDAWPKIGPTMRVHDVACRGSRGAGRSGSRPRRARGRGPPDRGRGVTAPGSTGAPSPACSARRVLGRLPGAATGNLVEVTPVPQPITFVDD